MDPHLPPTEQGAWCGAHSGPHPRTQDHHLNPRPCLTQAPQMRQPLTWKLLSSLVGSILLKATHFNSVSFYYIRPIHLHRCSCPRPVFWAPRRCGGLSLLGLASLQICSLFSSTRTGPQKPGPGRPHPCKSKCCGFALFASGRRWQELAGQEGALGVLAP